MARLRAIIAIHGPKAGGVAQGVQLFKGVEKNILDQVVDFIARHAGQQNSVHHRRVASHTSRANRSRSPSSTARTTATSTGSSFSAGALNG